MATIDEINAEIATLQTTLSGVLAGTIEEYSIAGRRVKYRDPQILIDYIASLRNQIAAQSSTFTYAGFNSPT